MSVELSHQQFLTNKRMMYSNKVELVVRKTQPTNILPGSRTFPAPGKSGIANCSCLACWHQAGRGKEEQDGQAGDGGGGKEHHACGLPPPSTGTYEATVNSMAGKASETSCWLLTAKDLFHKESVSFTVIRNLWRPLVGSQVLMTLDKLLSEEMQNRS